MFGVVVELRQLYPNNQIFFMAYGQVVSVMRERFDAGTLPDIAALVGTNGKSLFTDTIGHGGAMVLELGALTWMHTLYGALTRESPPTLLHRWDVDSVNEITTRALEYNEQFLAQTADDGGRGASSEINGNAADWSDDGGGGNVVVASQGVHPHVPFVDGANCLFIGHSFFVPISEDFDQLAQANGFPNHGYRQVFAGGEYGSPLALWNDKVKREEAAGILATGRVDLLGMTARNETDSDVAAYRNWIDLAREYNKETAFFIGLPWVNNPEAWEAAAYDAQLEAAYDDQVEERTAVVVELRRLYPENQVFVVAYRKVVSVMKERFEAGTLPDIAALVGKKSKSLFKDKFGHVGLMAQELSALTWMHTLYGADVGDLTLLRGWDEDSVADITSRALEFNEQFLA